MLIWILIFHLGMSCVEPQLSSNTEQPLWSDSELETDECIVQVEQGLLKGQRAISAGGGFVCSFQGVPFAKPPVGPLRFKDAEPPEQWDGVRDALSVASICPQPSSDMNGGIIGDEDCLYLNVYTPQLPPLPQEALPTMLWIHGGGYLVGSGHNNTYPDYLVSEGIIVATVNYRLSALGFLYLNEAAPGNAGLKDQVAAMRWLQRNIFAFGGDPLKITIVGQSAGGASVHLHMQSPMTRGLFCAAISQSGNALNRWGVSTDPLEISQQLALAVGCTVGDNLATVECLRGVDMATLMNAALTNVSLQRDSERLMIYTFVPTVDFPAPGVERFLPAPPIYLMSAGVYHPVPYITGFNNNESLIIAQMMNIFEKTVAERVDGAWDREFLPELRLPQEDPNNKAALQDLRKFYMDGKALSSDTIKGFMEMMTDIYFGEGIYYTLNCMAAYQKAPLYHYSFTTDDALNLAKVEFEVTQYSGADHGDEIGYLFRSEILPSVPINSSAWTQRQRMVRLWTNFVKFGNPTPVDDTLLGVKWEQYTQDKRQFLVFDSSIRSDTNPNAERMAFWERFYSTYG